MAGLIRLRGAPGGNDGDHALASRVKGVPLAMLPVIKQSFSALVLVAALSLLSSASWAEVGSTTIDRLASASTYIVLGRVVKIHNLQGIHIAEILVQTVFKGAQSTTLFVLATGTWTCDSSHASAGETALWFLDEAEVSTLLSSREKHRLQSIRPDVDNIEHFRELLKRLVGAAKLYRISWSGYGRMPVDGSGSSAVVRLMTYVIWYPVPTVKKWNELRKEYSHLKFSDEDRHRYGWHVENPKYDQPVPLVELVEYVQQRIRFHSSNTGAAQNLRQ